MDKVKINFRSVHGSVHSGKWVGHVYLILLFSNESVCAFKSLNRPTDADMKHTHGSVHSGKWGRGYLSDVIIQQ